MILLKEDGDKNESDGRILEAITDVLEETFVLISVQFSTPRLDGKIFITTNCRRLIFNTNIPEAQLV